VRASLRSALEISRSPVLLTQQALLQLAAGDPGRARASAEEVLKTDPANVPAARIVAESYTMQNQPAKVLARMAELVQAAPHSAALHHLLGAQLLRAGRKAEARAEFEAAARIQPGFSIAVLALADLDRTEQRTDAARARLDALLSREPANTSALVLLAEVERDAGNRTAAIQRYRAALAVAPQNLEALNNLSSELTEDSPEEALALAQRAFDLAPENPAVQDTLGWIYYRRGVYQTATTLLKAAVAREPNPRRQFHLGLCYLKAGDVRQGRELMQLAIREDPKLRFNTAQ